MASKSSYRVKTKTPKQSYHEPKIGDPEPEVVYSKFWKDLSVDDTRKLEEYAKTHPGLDTKRMDHMVFNELNERGLTKEDISFISDFKVKMNKALEEIRGSASAKENFKRMSSKAGMAGHSVYHSDTLSHHGIEGQKWGIRRFQNPDGSLTAAGKARYYTDNDAYGRDLSDEELRNAVTRMNNEKSFKALNDEIYKTPEERAAENKAKKKQERIEKIKDAAFDAALTAGKSVVSDILKNGLNYALGVSTGSIEGSMSNFGKYLYSGRAAGVAKKSIDQTLQKAGDKVMDMKTVAEEAAKRLSGTETNKTAKTNEKKGK